MRFLDVKIKYI